VSLLAVDATGSSSSLLVSIVDLVAIVVKASVGASPPRFGVVLTAVGPVLFSSSVVENSSSSMLAPCEDSDSCEVGDVCIIALGNDDDWLVEDIGVAATSLSPCTSFNTLAVVFEICTIVVKTSVGASTPSIAVVSSNPVGSIASRSVVVDLYDCAGESGAVASCKLYDTLVEIIFDVPCWSGEPAPDPTLVTSVNGKDMVLSASTALSVSADHALLSLVTMSTSPGAAVDETASGVTLVDGPDALRDSNVDCGWPA
jgi:hypothetical protein